MSSLPTPPPEAIIYEDERLYVCLASYPLTRGHTIVAWKGDVKDLNLLNRDDYEYLMDVVEKARIALMETLSVEKVYLLYMDEVEHVHWHLIPRYKLKGIMVLNHKTDKLENYGLAGQIRKNW